jgi:hypothetical protein
VRELGFDQVVLVDIIYIPFSLIVIIPPLVPDTEPLCETVPEDIENGLVGVLSGIEIFDDVYILQ